MRWPLFFILIFAIAPVASACGCGGGQCQEATLLTAALEEPASREAPWGWLLGGLTGLAALHAARLSHFLIASATATASEK